MSSVADTTPNGAPNNFQFLGRAEHTRVLTAKTRFCHTYEGSVREREPGDFSSISPKVAATSSPTIFRSQVCTRCADYVYFNLFLLRAMRTRLVETLSIGRNNCMDYKVEN